MSKNVSEPKSWEGFNPLKFIKGQKKTIIAIIGMGLGYLISNNETIAVLSSIIFGGLYAGAEYYLKKVDNR